jgi:hypothetical protein
VHRTESAAAEAAVLEEMPHLVSRFLLKQQRGMQTGQDDMVGLASQSRAFLVHKKVSGRGDHTQFRHLG